VQTEPTSVAAGNHRDAIATGSGVFQSVIGGGDNTGASADDMSRGGSDSSSAFDRLLKYGGGTDDEDAQFLARLLATPPDARSSSSSSLSSSSSSIRVLDRLALRRTIFHLYAQCVEQRVDALQTGGSLPSSLVAVCNEYFLRHCGSRFAARVAFYNFCHRYLYTKLIHSM
jgi:hypothetical protein